MATRDISLLKDIFDSSVPLPQIDNAKVATPAFDSVANPAPPNFPAGIMLDHNLHTYRNWCWDIEVDDIWVAVPNSFDQVRQIADWAVTENYKIRAVGMMHNWSPIVLDKSDLSGRKVLLVSTQLLNQKRFDWDGDKPTATFGTGVTIEDATDFLEHQENQGSGKAPGFTFTNMTGPGDISLGGALAVGAHGTSVPVGDAKPESMLGGSLSNLVLKFKAVVSDPANAGKYMIKEFLRSDPDAAAFLVHLGRAFIVEVTMRVVPNFFLDQVNHWVPIDVALELPNSLSKTLQRMVESTGRVEVIWFPGTLEAWLKTWQEVPTPVGTATLKPYNEDFTFLSDERNIYVRNLLRKNPALNPAYFSTALNHVRSNDYHQLSGTSRSLQLYVKPKTLRVTALGYAIQIKRSEIHSSAHEFIKAFRKIMMEYGLKYPVSGAIELRYTTMDLTDPLGIGAVQPPSLSASNSVDPGNKELDTIFWADILSIPGINAHTIPFFAEMEDWIFNQWGNRVRPEWSKGWACTKEGKMWANEEVIERVKNGYYNATYEYTRSTLAKHDKNNLYTNAFLDKLLPG